MTGFAHAVLKSGARSFIGRYGRRLTFHLFAYNFLLQRPTREFGMLRRESYTISLWTNSRSARRCFAGIIKGMEPEVKVIEARLQLYRSHQQARIGLREVQFQPFLCLLLLSTITMPSGFW